MLIAEKNKQQLRAEGYKRQLGLRTEELTRALSTLETMKDKALYKRLMEDTLAHKAEMKRREWGLEAAQDSIRRLQEEL